VLAAQAATRRSVAVTRAPSRVGLRSPPPQPRGHGQGHRLPDPSLADRDADLVGLHLAPVHLPRLHRHRMHPCGVGPRAPQPRRPRALVQSERGHDGRHGTAVAQQRHHQHQHLHRVVQPVEGRPPRRRDGLAAGRAAVPPRLLTMDANGPAPLLPLVRAVPVRAKYSGRVPASCAPGRVSKTRLLVACRMRLVPVSIASPPRFSGVVPQRGCCLNWGDGEIVCLPGPCTVQDVYSTTRSSRAHGHRALRWARYYQARCHEDSRARGGLAPS